MGRARDRAIEPGPARRLRAPHRYFDDVTRRSAREGATSVVVLGAGFDTRAHRLPELGAARVFEVDQAEVVRKKRAALSRAGVPSESVPRLGEVW